MKIAVSRIDLDSEANQRDNIFQGMRDYYGADNVLNTLTLKTEGTKSTVQVCAKGFGINNDDAQYLSDLIPFERGANWSLKDCFEGNEEKGRAPQTEFINELKKYPGLKETLLKVEGLICGRSIHASASYIFDAGYLAQNSRMRAPNGTWITAYNMEDSDDRGGLKIDTLTTQIEDKLHKAINLLIDNEVIEDKGSIKANYDEYLHPDKLEYNDYRMWNALDTGKIVDAFQFDTPMGKKVIDKTQPRSMLQLSTANSLMRLMPQDSATEPPMDIYKKYKENISLWYDEMRQCHLTDKEIKLMEKHLKPLYGVADTQESIMELSMDPEISGFDVVLANKLRKSVAKKKPKLIAEMEEKFYQHGLEIGTSKELLDYVWKIQVKRQLGYSFSKNHCMPYTNICIQSMNIYKDYKPIYWNCACLSVNSGSTDENGEDDNNTDYGRIAKAMGDMQKAGVKIMLPNINRSKYGFYPDDENDEILYGLKAIQGVSSGVVGAIIANRPYTSAHQFYDKMQDYKDEDKNNKFGDTAMITLIKAGCFDNLEKRPREEILRDFIRSISSPIKKLSMDNVEDLNKLGLLTEAQKKYELRLIKFRKWVYQKKFFVKQNGKSASTAYYKLDRKFSEPFFYEHFETDMVEGKDYEYTEDGFIAVKRGSLDRVFDKKISQFKEDVLNNPKNLEAVNEERFDNLWKEKAEGNISKWEMDSLSFYYTRHELADVNRGLYSIVNFDDLSESPTISSTSMWKGIERPRYVLSRICGTVLSRNKLKNIITLLTPDGVVSVKFYKGQFGFYDKQISKINEDGTKTVIEKSWFSRGNKLLVTGFRREDQFIPRKYVDSVFKHSLQLINGIREDGSLILQSERAGQEEL